MEAIIYNQQAKEAGKIALPEEVFGLNWNADLVHQVVTSMNMDARTPYAHTKTRAEVRGGGKKPWQQKGTGRARHGSSRSPIWVKGGVAHGPRNDKNYSRKVNRKMKSRALNVILSAKLKDQEVLFVDAISMNESKTKHAADIIKTLGGSKAFGTLGTKRANAAIIAFPSKDIAIERAFRNIGKISIMESRNLSPVDLLNYKYVIFVNPAESIKPLSEKSSKRVKEVAA
jgi:large subunit ribosomal protein L4